MNIFLSSMQKELELIRDWLSMRIQTVEQAAPNAGSNDSMNCALIPSFQTVVRIQRELPALHQTGGAALTHLPSKWMAVIDDRASQPKHDAQEPSLDSDRHVYCAFDLGLRISRSSEGANQFDQTEPAKSESHNAWRIYTTSCRERAQQLLEPTQVMKQECDLWLEFDSTQCSHLLIRSLPLPRNSCLTPFIVDDCASLRMNCKCRSFANWRSSERLHQLILNSEMEPPFFESNLDRVYSYACSQRFYSKKHSLIRKYLNECANLLIPTIVCCDHLKAKVQDPSLVDGSDILATNPISEVPSLRLNKPCSSIHYTFGSITRSLRASRLSLVKEARTTHRTEKKSKKLKTNASVKQMKIEKKQATERKTKSAQKHMVPVTTSVRQFMFWYKNVLPEECRLAHFRALLRKSGQ